jgi:hypothetical protein
LASIVPLVSSSAKGPLGVYHLPRLWLKMLLDAIGKLPAGYRAGEGGFDEDTLDNLGLDLGELRTYVQEVQPTYLEFEAWVREHAKHLDADSIAKHNAYILNRDKSDENAKKQVAEIGAGAPQDTRNAVLLNDLDDWMTFHRAVVER